MTGRVQHFVRRGEPNCRRRFLHEARPDGFGLDAPVERGNRGERERESNRQACDLYSHTRDRACYPAEAANAELVLPPRRVAGGLGLAEQIGACARPRCSSAATPITKATRARYFAPCEVARRSRETWTSPTVSLSSPFAEVPRRCRHPTAPDWRVPAPPIISAGYSAYALLRVLPPTRTFLAFIERAGTAQLVF